MEQQQDILKYAIQYLAGVCDGARARDGHGFNKIDAQFGRSLALAPLWSTKQREAAYKMVKRYRQQLLEIGIDVDKIEPMTIHAKREAEEFVKQKQQKTEQNIQKRHIEWDSQKNEFVVRFPYNAEIVSAVKQIPGRAFSNKNPKDPHWTVPANPVTIKALKEFASKFLFSTPDFDVILKEKETTQKVDVSQVLVETPIPLKPYQVEGVKYIVSKKRVLLADDMGLGKTAQALASLKAAGLYPALCIVPASVKYNWKIEVNKWTPEKKAIVVDTKTKIEDIKSHDIVIVNYDIYWRIPELKSIKWKAVIFDEAHRIKNPKANRSQFAKDLINQSKPEMRLIMTGTPVTNRPVELILPLTVIGRFKEMFPRGSMWYKQRYCGAYYNGFAIVATGATNTKELHEILTSTCMLRRKKEDVLKDMPALTRTVIPVEIDNAKEYRYAEKETGNYLREKILEQAKALGANMDEANREAYGKLRKYYSAEKLVRMETLKQLAAKGKMNAVKNWIEDFLESDEKLIVFANHIDIQKEILSMYPNAAHIFGEDSPLERQKNVERFQNDKNCKLIVCSLAAAGEGITLTASSNVLFVELGWTPSAHRQAEARAHRIGQNYPVNAWYIVAKDTIEEYIANMLDKKITTVRAVTDGEDIEEQESLIALVEKYLAEKGQNQ